MPKPELPHILDLCPTCGSPKPCSLHDEEFLKGLLESEEEAIELPKFTKRREWKIGKQKVENVVGFASGQALIHTMRKLYLVDLNGSARPREIAGKVKFVKPLPCDRIFVIDNDETDARIVDIRSGESLQKHPIYVKTEWGGSRFHIIGQPIEISEEQIAIARRIATQRNTDKKTIDIIDISGIEPKTKRIQWTSEGTFEGILPLPNGDIVAFSSSSLELYKTAESRMEEIQRHYFPTMYNGPYPLSGDKFFIVAYPDKLGGRIHIFDISIGQIKRKVKEVDMGITAAKKFIEDVYVAGDDSGRLAFLDMRSGSPVIEDIGQTDFKITSIDVIDEHKIMIGGDNGKAEFWSITDEDLRRFHEKKLAKEEIPEMPEW